MKSLLILLFTFSCLTAFAQSGQEKSLPDPNKKSYIVETSCGQCKFGLAGKSCDLAVRIDGKSYFVDGTSIDEHGDAHAKEGFCNTIRKAEVQGEIINGRYKVTYFKLLPSETKRASKD
jgi:hypothetical protein